MSILIPLLIILTSAVLIWLGSASLWPQTAVLLGGVVWLVYASLQRLTSFYQVRAATERNRAKWGSECQHFGGLFLFPGQKLILLLSRHDEWIFLGEEFREALPLSQVSAMLAIQGHQLRKISDRQLLRYLNFDDPQSLNAIREQLRKGYSLGHRQLLLIARKDSDTDDLPPAEGGRLIVLELLQGQSALRRLLKRPEIRVKTRVFKHRSKNNAVELAR